ncbi:hypothetical protein GM921_07790 [Pedobacter sp. LMG 31464]|uniref:Uncharacterized protein n=1 Tax=Pedobacter planticolens TaxID=2679964 RepID=A0A923IU10_9SPHI|nr:hypothetical protein [Pedobacter planticolens]MBB2145380.1 hypothetical protein [Pedobacter planticolens]
MKFLLTLIIAVFCNTAFAQFANLKGIAFRGDRYETEEGKEATCNEYYSFSFTDKMLSHLVLTDKSEYSDNQFYKIIKYDVKYIQESEKTVFTIDALSGLSGSTYNYIITIYNSGKGNVKRNNRIFLGSFYDLKTYAQE